ETRSSQSPTATLSDFVLGSFNTCNLVLPNTATVKADNLNNGQPITSNQAVITVNDGDGSSSASASAGPLSLSRWSVPTAGDPVAAAAGPGPAGTTATGATQRQ